MNRKSIQGNDLEFLSEEDNIGYGTLAGTRTDSTLHVS
jgi:hypothetical protein